MEELERSVGFSTKEILDRPPIRMLEKVVGKDRIETYLAMLLTKLMAQVNISENLNIQPFQIPIIAAQLIESYPVESLEDFTLCFKRGAGGFYGTIYRLDAATLMDWMAKYLNEKYTYVENEAQKVKDETDKANEVNYESFKKRVPEYISNGKSVQSSASENEIQRQKLSNPYTWHKVRGVEILATSQEHAEQLVQKMIDIGELIEG